MGEMRGSSAQKTLPGLETIYEPIKSWEIKQNCHIDHRAMKGLSANIDVMPENSLMLILLNMRACGILTHLPILSFP